MTAPEAPIAPTEISLHQKSRLLEIAFADGFRFNYPCEYLRVFSPATPERAMDQPVHGKEMVSIRRLEPQGTAALQVEFDDGHSAGYFWSSLHELGVNYAPNWQAYLRELAAHDLQPGVGRAAGADGKVTVNLLYFIELAKIAGKDGEELQVPASVNNVETLLAWLRDRGEQWREAFADDKVRVAVNKHFAELYTLVEQGDEVALVPLPK
jgi:DUF971 family protein/molybdopterin converting factor small subunit